MIGRYRKNVFLPLLAAIAAIFLLTMSGKIVSSQRAADAEQPPLKKLGELRKGLPQKLPTSSADLVQSSLSTGIGPDGTVLAIAVSGNTVYVGGTFATAGGNPVNYIAKWDGSKWSALGSGMNGQVNALVIGGNGDLYAGGNFTMAGGVSANRIARWNGSSWSAVGAGLNASVDSLAISGNTIYVGGGFDLQATGCCFARWNGSNWAVVGSGLGNSVSSIVLSGNDVYVGGMFLNTGNTGSNPAMRIARWNGSTWSTFGSGINTFGGVWEVRSILLSGGNVYAGGNFTTAGGQPANNIAVWNGFAWSTFGSGMNGTVHALSLAGNGDIYAGGGFTNAAGISADRIARWDGSSWSPVGSGMNNTVIALAIANDGTVYAGGNFITAGGKRASNIARWNGTEWSDLVSPAAPTQAANITFSNVQPYQMDVNWTKGDGHRRLVKINTVNSFTTPADGSDPSANSQYVGSGEQVVYNGSGSSFKVTGLLPGTTYYFRVFEYNNYGPYTLFGTNSAANNPNSQITASCNAATVLNTNDSGAGSLRQAIADITGCGTISFDSSVFATPQTITLTSGTLVINKDLAIQGPGANLLSISGNDASRVFEHSSEGSTLNGMTIRNGSDGGISTWGQLTVSNSVITQNGGSGISGGGSIIVSNSTISGNAHMGINSDAGCYFTAYLSVSNSTISGNGGIGIISYDGIAEIANSTIVNNRGGFFSTDDCRGTTSRLWNTIVAGNTLSPPLPYGLSGTDIFGSGIAAASHNIIGDPAHAGGIQNSVNGNIVGADPLLGPLQDNGGPTFTHALLTGSPAFNAGDSCVLIIDGCGEGIPALTTDQRGSPRNGTVDIGAFEAQPSELSVVAWGLSGRVLTPGGTGMRNTAVTLTDSAGNRRTVMTSTLGFYSFNDIPAGETVVITAASRRYRFEPRTRTMNANLADVDLVGIE